MFWQDKHFLSCANITNEIELPGELNGCVGSEVFEGVRLEQVNAGWGWVRGITRGDSETERVLLCQVSCEVSQSLQRL